MRTFGYLLLLESWDLMEKFLNRKSITRGTFYLIGCMLLSFGVALTIVSNFGAGSWDAVAVGLSTLTGLTMGNMVVVVAVFLVILSGVLLKKIPRLTTLITSFFLSFFIDLWLPLLSPISAETFVSSFLLFVLGMGILAIGVTMTIVSDLPPGPIDYFMLSVKERFNLQIGIAKTSTEIFGMALGFLLGGPIGIGTFLMVFGLGPIIQFVLKFTTPAFNRISTPKEKLAVSQ